MIHGLSRLGYWDGSDYRFDEELLRRNLEFRNGELPKYITDFHIPVNSEVEFKAECTVDIPALKKLRGIDIANGIDVTRANVILGVPYQEQIRKHKKRRIKKKWAKRYGYRTKFRQVIVDEFRCAGYCEKEIEVIGRCRF